MFKEPPQRLLGDAWRILLAASEGKQLLPAHVQWYWRRHVAKWEGGASLSQHACDRPAFFEKMQA